MLPASSLRATLAPSIETKQRRDRLALDLTALLGLHSSVTC